MSTEHVVDYEKYLGKPKWMPIPSPLYLSEDDNLLFRVQSSAPILSLAYRARFLECDGSIHSEEQALTVTTDRTLQTTLARARRGYLLSLSVFATAGTPRRGECYCTVSLARGLQGDVQFFHVLAKGYIVANEALHWPGGLYENAVSGAGDVGMFQGTNPAAGAEISETVPAGARWRLRGFRATLVTNVTVATRQVHLIIDTGALQFLDFPANGTQAASLTRNYDGSAMAAIPAATDSEIYIPIPQDLVLVQGWRIRTVTTNLQAGDDWGTPRIYFEELSES